MSLDRPVLAEAFTRARPDRAASLTNLLPAPRPRPAAETTEPAPSEVTPERAPATRAPVAAPTRPVSVPKSGGKKQPEPGTPASQQATVVTNVAVYLEPDLLELARTSRRLTGRTYDELTVEAFAAVADDDLERVLRPLGATTSGSGMPLRQRRLRGTAGIQVQLRLDTAQRDWIDQKAAALGAPSRSALVAAVLRLHLKRSQAGWSSRGL